MGLFLFSFFLVYALLNFYVLLKLKHAFPVNRVATVCVSLFMLSMVFAPVAVRLMEKAGQDDLARFAAYTGYTWMVLLFLFFSVSIFIDLIRLCIYFCGLIIKKDVSGALDRKKYFFIVPSLCALLVTPYGFYEATQIGVKRLTIETPKIKRETGLVRIVQISDVHIGLIINKKRMGKIADIIKAIKPDILVSTGALIDGRFNRLKTSIEPLKQISTTYGKFAVTGNHEYYAGIDTSVDLTEQAGFYVLRNKAVDAGGIINIVGVDDIASLRFKNNFIHESALLKEQSLDKYTILLKHRPVIDQGAIDLFDLQLSGHTHRGQIFPFNYIVKIFFPLYNGFYRISDKSSLYTSGGTGTWGPPIRFLAPPEITVIELIHSEERT